MPDLRIPKPIGRGLRTAGDGRHKTDNPMPGRHLKRMAAVLALTVAGFLFSIDADSAEKSQVDLVISGDYVVTMNQARRVIADGAIAVDGGVIVAVGKRDTVAAAYEGRENIAGGDRVLMPGLINGHTHAAMTLFRGVADDLDLMTWLREYIFPLEGRFVDADFVRIGTRLACWEMIRGGTTTFVDMYFYPDTIAEVVVECGLRAVVAAPSIDFSSPGFEGWEDSFAASLAFVKRWKNRSERVIPALGPHAPYTVAPDHLRQVVAAARELDVPISIHISEDRSEVADMKKRYGSASIDHLDGLGFLDHRIIGAHVVWPQETEIPILAARKVGVIHNPTSNLKTAAGISPVPRMLAAGVRIGLGTDGAASNNDLDMWQEIRLAALIHKGTSGDPTVMPAGTVLRMATIGGAEALRLDKEIGSLEVGKRADVIQVSLEEPRRSPLYDVVSHLVYVAASGDVVTTIVNGRVLMRDGDILTLQAGEVRSAAREKARLIKRELARK